MAPEDVEGGPLEVQGGDEGEEELGQVEDGEAHEDGGARIDFLRVHQLEENSEEVRESVESLP